MRNFSAYNRTSIALHWISAIAIVALFVTHEGERGSATTAFHVGVGALIGPILVWRILRRMRLGTAQKPQQAEAFNLLAHIVLWAMLAAILLLAITGYLLPWSLGRPLDVFGWAIASPIPGLGWLHEIVEGLHSFCGNLILPLVLLHLAGVAKHVLLDSDRMAVLRRMTSPQTNGQ
jgi:cytochrome b561